MNGEHTRDRPDHRTQQDTRLIYSTIPSLHHVVHSTLLVSTCMYKPRSAARSQREHSLVRVTMRCPPPNPPPPHPISTLRSEYKSNQWAGCKKNKWLSKHQSSPSGPLRRPKTTRHRRSEHGYEWEVEDRIPNKILPQRSYTTPTQTGKLLP